MLVKYFAHFLLGCFLLGIELCYFLTECLSLPLCNIGLEFICRKVFIVIYSLLNIKLSDIPNILRKIFKDFVLCRVVQFIIRTFFRVFLIIFLQLKDLFHS